MATEEMFPAHKAELSLIHNAHLNYRETILEWESNLKSCCNAKDDDLLWDWVSLEQRDKAIATDSVWVLQWYPQNPVSSYRLLACDLDVLLAEAKSVEKDE